MARALILFAVALAGCGETKLRQVPCERTGTCDGGEQLVVPPFDMSDAGWDAGESADAGEPSDSGEPLDAGEPFDAGPEDAGVVEVIDAGPEDAGIVELPDAGETLPNVDLLCHDPDAGVVFPPITELPNTVPANCLTGFELNNYHSTYSIDSVPVSGSRAIMLEVDLATYQQPDIIRMEATTNGIAQDLLLTCRLKTWDNGDPTRGLTRPPEAAIRSFRVPLPAGTTRLSFDFNDATTPTYIRVLGLCDFDLQPPSPTNLRWRRVTSR